MLPGCPVVLSLASSKTKRKTLVNLNHMWAFFSVLTIPHTHHVCPLWKYLEGSEVSKFTVVGATTENVSFDPSMIFVFKKLTSNQGIYLAWRLFDDRLLNNFVLSFI